MSWCYLNLTFDPVVVFLTFEILLSCVSETGVGILVISTLKNYTVGLVILLTGVFKYRCLMAGKLENICAIFNPSP